MSDRPLTPADEQALAADLSLCEMGLALTRGALRKRYERQYAACVARIQEANRADGLGELTADELFAELSA